MSIAELAAIPDRHGDVGPKAATLGRLIDLGFAVPPGVVISPTSGSEDAKLTGFLADHAGDRFAVRSSGLDEDGADSSMAGRYRSFLDVPAEAVPQRIEECRSFAATSRGGRNGPLPVIVQVMVSARVAGVAFTADPLTGQRDTVVVSATAGLADRLLAGEEAGEEWEVVGRRARCRSGRPNVARRRLVKEVASVSLSIADRLGAPQDVEWAWDGEHLWIVQSRPITGLPPQVSWDTDEAGVFHRGFRFGEWIPEPVTPLFESWLLTTMEQRLHQIHRNQIGQLARQPLHVVVNGWYFYSLNFLPVPGASLWRSLPRVLRLAVTTPRRVAVMFPQTVLSGYPLYEDDWRNDLDPQYRSAVAAAEARVDSASPHELVEMVEDLAALAGEYFASIAVVAGSTYKVETLLGLFWNRHLRGRLDMSYMELLGGFHQPGAEGPLLASLDWYVEPVRTPGSPAQTDRGLEARRLRAERAAREVLAGSPRRLRRFERLTRHAQHLQPVREAQMAGLTLAWPVMRRAVMLLGNALVDRGVVEVPEDVFFLTRGELSEVLEQPRSISETVAERRAFRDWARRLVPPEALGKMPLMTRVAFMSTNVAVGARTIDGALVSGVPASPGIATGPVRIVPDITAFERVQPGDVIVAPLTAPAWTPLFEKAAALVTDVGSGLAHASIMAREYGIPAVVGCGDATRRLVDGQLVTVNGLAGAVTPAASSDRDSA